MFKKLVFSFTAFILKKATWMRMSENPLHKENIDISNKVFYSSPIDGIHNIPRRIENQKCGLLLGANIFAKNTYAYRIIAKIHLKNSNITTTKKICEMFPPKEEDLLFKTYSDIKPKLNGLYG